MSQSAQPNECPAALLAAALEVIQGDDAAGLARVEALLTEYADPRLYFLRGSLLAGLARYDEARVAMATALDVAPGYAIARYQLGFLELTSGNADAAQTIWAPFAALADDDAMRVLTEGLGQLARDEFPQAFETLERGMALNTENAFVNSDVRLLIDSVQQKLAESAPPAEEATSATHLLLQQYKNRPTEH